MCECVCERVNVCSVKSALSGLKWLEKRYISAVHLHLHLHFVLVRSAREVMAASLAQGGPCSNFMRERCFKYLCSGDSDSILVSASDVTDSELSLLIERVNTILSNLVIALTSL